ncbi:MAG: hypothetical protein JW931_00435 [Methanomicrobiaceae archaeon]|nr:hypothetical protein [Methanomicrobiaceae archaeon]
MKRKKFDDLPGSTDEEKYSSISIKEGAKLDILDLKKIHDTYNIRIVVYFEKDLAENSTYEKDLVDFAGHDEDMRPFIEVEKFIQFGIENDPTFKSRLDEFPLMIRIISTGEMESENKKVRYVKGLMPFLDDFDVDADPGPVIG